MLSRRRCGKPTCWCADGDGHPQWTLTYSVEGVRHVEHIPAELADELLPLVEQGQAYRDAVAEIRSINAQLIKLWRRQQREKRSKTRGKKKR